LGTVFTFRGLIWVQCSNCEVLFGYSVHIERPYLGTVFTMREILFGYIVHIERSYLGTVFTLRGLIWVQCSH